MVKLHQRELFVFDSELRLLLVEEVVFIMGGHMKTGLNGGTRGAGKAPFKIWSIS